MVPLGCLDRDSIGDFAPRILSGSRERKASDRPWAWLRTAHRGPREQGSDLEPTA